MRSSHDESLARLQALSQHIQLVSQRLALRTAFFRLSGNALHYIIREVCDLGRSKNIVEFGDDVLLDSFDSNIIEEALVGDLIRLVNHGMTCV